jgi:small subunit ribosomal protein S2
LITKKRLTLEQLLLAKVHLGHNSSLWNQWCSSFLFGERYNQHIFDLSKSLFHMKKILKVLALLSNNKGKILFISTKTDKSRLIESLIPNNHMFLCSSWVGGLLTNWHSLTEPFHSNILEKERSIKSLFRKKVRLLKIFRGFFITGRITSKLPDLIVFLNVNENRFAIKEAQQLNIPTIGIVDSDSDPRGLTYVIPGNDDSIESHLFYLQFFKKALTK